MALLRQKCMMSPIHLSIVIATFECSTKIWSISANRDVRFSLFNSLENETRKQYAFAKETSRSKQKRAKIRSLKAVCNSLGFHGVCVSFASWNFNSYLEGKGTVTLLPVSWVEMGRYVEKVKAYSVESNFDWLYSRFPGEWQKDQRLERRF